MSSQINQVKLCNIVINLKVASISCTRSISTPICIAITVAPNVAGNLSSAPSSSLLIKDLSD